MLIHIKQKTSFLKETSTHIIKLISASRYCTSSRVYEKFDETSECYDTPVDRREYKYNTQRKYDSYYSPKYSSHPNSRFNQKFEYKKRNFNADWHSSLSKNNRETAVSPSDDERIPVHIEKFFYVEHPDVAGHSEEEAENYRKSVNIRVKGENIPKPITKFSELCLPENLMKALNAENYSEPSPIQSQGFPVALSGRDMIGVSQTGSGKTLAYMLPAVVHASNQNHSKIQKGECRPQVLVLGPTRELVQQIHQVSQKFIKACGLFGATVYGGASKQFQLSCLEGAEICIATPGRLLDFLVGREVSLDNCSYLVLDEADRMLDMGFEPQIRDIIHQIRSDRQTLMWSATWPSEIRNLAENFLNNFIHVTIGSGELSANPNIQQNIYVVADHEKEDRFFSLLENIMSRKSKVLVFAQTKRKVDFLTEFLNKRRIQAVSIHGDFSQSRRDRVLLNFRKSKSCVLIATDIAARGLDIIDIDHVMNFDFPTNIEDYIHRIGRTARGSAHGQSHSFFTQEDARLLKELLTVLEKSNQQINPELYTLLDANKTSRFSYNKQYGRKRMHRYM